MIVIFFIVTTLIQILLNRKKRGVYVDVYVVPISSALSHICMLTVDQRPAVREDLSLRGNDIYDTPHGFLTYSNESAVDPVLVQRNVAYETATRSATPQDEEYYDHIL